MIHPDFEYGVLARRILAEGVERPDRTGTGTLSVFGHQMRFDLSQGFPLLTTKRVFWKGVVDELLWFLSGSTSVEDLPQRTQQWWNPWADSDGNLGPIYGEQYRKSRWWFEVTPKIFPIPKLPVKKEGLFLGIGDLGSYRLSTGINSLGEPEHITNLKNTWRDMLKRCYSPNAKEYKAYGAIGVHVDPEWLSFSNFCRDAQKLPQWSLKLEYPKKYTIDKDIRFASNRYSLKTCMWATPEEQGWNTSTGTPFTAISPKGEKFLFPSLGDMSRSEGTNVSAIHRCLNGKLKTHHGWSNFEYTGGVKRFRQVDQLQLLISEIKHNPESRRNLINLWHTPAMQHGNLPCCHGSVIQFYVENNRLSCHTYQRSGDVLLGVPVNIASYALFTHMIAHICELDVGELIYSIGDAHIYLNHVEQITEQLQREARPSPELLITRNVKDIDDFSPSDFELRGYDPHPAIKAPVAV
jgi:thymidylate synthase